MKKIKNKILMFCSKFDIRPFNLLILIIASISSLVSIIYYAFNPFSIFTVCNSIMAIIFLGTFILYELKPNKNQQDNINSMILLGILYLFLLFMTK